MQKQETPWNDHISSVYERKKAGEYGGEIHCRACGRSLLLVRWFASFLSLFLPSGLFAVFLFFITVYQCVSCRSLLYFLLFWFPMPSYAIMIPWSLPFSFSCATHDEPQNSWEKRGGIRRLCTRTCSSFLPLPPPPSYSLSRDIWMDITPEIYSRQVGHRVLAEYH